MSKSVSNTATFLDCHRKVADFKLRAEALEFSPLQWELLSHVDGRRSAAQIGARMEVPADVIWEQLCKFERVGLVAQHRIACPWGLGAGEHSGSEEQAEVCMLFSPGHHATASEAAALVPSPPVQVPLSVPAPTQPPVLAAAPVMPSVVALQLGRKDKRTPATQVPAVALPTAAIQVCLSRSRPPAVPASAPSTVRVSLKPAGAQASAVVSTQLAGPVGLEPGLPASTPTPGPVPAGSGKAWPIRPLLEALRRKAGDDALVAQLLAYRVFLRVPAQLLEDSGIRSISLIDPDLMLNNGALKEALASSLRDVTGLDWPEAA